MAKIDTVGFKGHPFSKTWYVNQSVGGVVGPYDLTGKNVHLLIFDRTQPTPIQLYDKTALTLGNGYVVFSLANTETINVTPVDYQILEDPGANQILLHHGTITFTDLATYIPFRDIVANETPPGLTIPENYITIKSYEWREFLRDAVDPHIDAADVTNETAWPVLVNFLIAKLIVYQYLLKSLSSYVARNDGSGSEENAALVKKIETGPTNAEFWDGTSGLAKLFQTGKDGKPLVNTLAQEACMLAKRLSIYLPICDNAELGITVSLKVGRETIDPVTYLLDNYGQ